MVLEPVRSRLRTKILRCLVTLNIHGTPVPLRIDVDGVVRIAKTRVTLDTFVAAFREGATAEEMVHQYPSLYLVDVYSVIAYYLANRPGVETYLKEHERLGVEVRRENEARFEPHGVRDRLLARRAAAG